MNVLLIIASGKNVVDTFALVKKRYPEITPIQCSIQPISKAYKKDQYFQFTPGKEFETITAFLKGKQVKGIINRVDHYQLLHSQLLEYYKLTGPSTKAIKTLTNKASLHHMMEKLNLGFYRPRTIVSDLQSIRDNLKQVQFPVIIKPFLGAKSRGVHKLNSIEDYDLIEPLLQAYFDKASIIKVRRVTKPKVLIEEFINGQQVTPTSYIDSQGRFHLLALVDVYTAKDVGQNHQQLIFRTTPSRRKESIRQKIQFIMQTIAKHTKLKSTCIHPEFFVYKNHVYLIEINVRIGGFRAELTKLAQNIDLNLLALQLALGQPVEDYVADDQSATACEVWEETSGTIKELSLPKSRYIKKSQIFFKPGDEYTAPPYSDRPLANFFVATPDNSLIVAKKIRKGMKIAIE